MSLLCARPRGVIMADSRYLSRTLKQRRSLSSKARSAISDGGGRQSPLLLRSALYVPGNTKLLSKIFGFQSLPDVLVPDLEDSVPFDQKQEALRCLKSFFADCWIPTLQVAIQSAISGLNAEGQQQLAEAKLYSLPEPQQFVFLRQFLLSGAPFMMPRLNKDHFAEELGALIKACGPNVVIDAVNVGKTNTKEGL